MKSLLPVFLLAVFIISVICLSLDRLWPEKMFFHWRIRSNQSEDSWPKRNFNQSNFNQSNFNQTIPGETIRCDTIPCQTGPSQLPADSPPPIKVAVCLAGDLKNYRPFTQNQHKLFFDQPDTAVHLFTFTSTLIHYRNPSIVWSHTSLNETTAVDWLRSAHGKHLLSFHVDVNDEEFASDAAKHGIFRSAENSRRWNMASQMYKIVRCLRMVTAHPAGPFDVFVRMRLDGFFPAAMDIKPVANSSPESVFYAKHFDDGYVTDSFLASSSLSHLLSGYERILNDYLDPNLSVMDPEAALRLVFPVFFFLSTEAWRVGNPPTNLLALPWFNKCFLKDVHSDEYAVNLDPGVQPPANCSSVPEHID